MKTKEEILRSKFEYQDNGANGYSKEGILEAMEEYKNQDKPALQDDFRSFFHFKYKTPEPNRTIYYLIGNGIDGIDCPLKMVVGEYYEKAGDFDKDENGNFKYVTYWAYGNN